MQFKWLNESKVTITDDRIEMLASPGSDFFCSSESAGEEGITPESLCNAPYYYTEIKGDFVLKVKASHNFISTYDAAVPSARGQYGQSRTCCSVSAGQRRHTDF